MRPRQGSIAGTLLLAGFGAQAPAAAQVQSWVPERGHGTLSAAYQQHYVEKHTDLHGHAGTPAKVHSRGVLLGLDYGITDRLAVSVNLPYRSNRYCGPRPHDPQHELEHDHGQDFIDNCRYHGTWADWGISLRYQMQKGSWAITPFVAAGWPATDYNTFTHAPAGLGIRSLTLGTSVGHRFEPPWQNAYVQGTYGYSFLERVIDRRIAQSKLGLETGYHFTPRFSARAYLNLQKVHHGLRFPDDYLDEHGQRRRDELYFHHDVTMRNDYVFLGAGASYALDEDYILFGNLGRTMWSRNGHPLDYAYTIGVGRKF